MEEEEAKLSGRVHTHFYLPSLAVAMRSAPGAEVVKQLEWVSVEVMPSFRWRTVALGRSLWEMEWTPPVLGGS